MNDTAHMKRAIELARQAFDAGEVPVGAILVDHHINEVIAGARNQVEALGDPTAHAEFLAIQKALSSLHHASDVKNLSSPLAGGKENAQRSEGGALTRTECLRLCPPPSPPASGVGDSSGRKRVEDENIKPNVSNEDKYLSHCDLYVTLEPCAMCAGAIAHARIRRVIFGAYDPKSGGVEHGPKVFDHNTTHHKPEVIGGALEAECSELMKEFFARLR